MMGVLLWSCDSPPRCNDGEWNGTETAIDCGGDCAPCYSCTDSIRNQGEAGIDCGGPCDLCPDQWAVLPDRFGGENLEKVHFFDRDHGVVCSAAAAYLTSDGGGNWLRRPLPQCRGGSVRAIRRLRFLTNQFGYLLVDLSEATIQSVLITRDGGASWTEVQVEGWPSATPYGSTCADFFSPTTGVLITQEAPNLTWWGYGPSIAYKTTDGGLSWQPVHAFYTLVPNSEVMTGVYCMSDASVLTHNGYGNYQRNAGGSTEWVDLPNFPRRTDIWFFGLDSILVLNEAGGLSLSIDKGATWEIIRPYLQAQQLPKFGVLEDGLVAFRWVTPHPNGSDPNNLNRYVVLERTADLGLHWEWIGFFYSEVDISYRYALRDWVQVGSRFYVVGDKGLLMRLDRS